MMDVAQRRLDARLTDPFEVTTAGEDDAAGERKRHELTEGEILGIIVAQSLGELDAERAQVATLLELAHAASLLATAKGGVTTDERRIFAAAEGGTSRA